MLYNHCSTDIILSNDSFKRLFFRAWGKLTFSLHFGMPQFYFHSILQLTCFLPAFLYTLTHTHILKGLLSFSSKWKLNDIIYTSIYVKFGIKCIYFTHSLLQTHQRGGISYLYNPIYYLLQSANATIHKITPW